MFIFIKMDKWCVTFICIFAVCLCGGEDSTSQRIEEGYPRGLMSVCPGSTKPATIPISQLKYLGFVVQGKERSRKKYTYWTADKIANDVRIDFNRKTVLILLGYLDSSNFPIASMFANEYEALGYNVIIIDNQRFATVHYYLASRLMRPVGKHVAEVLVKLTNLGLDPSKLELLGFSLGGQTVSYIAKNYQQMTGMNISKITALEPSGPCFRHLGPGDRLDASDADFVEVIHSNIDGYGMATRMGHVDFYLNGGEYQPSDLSMYPCVSTCSHFRVLPIWVSAMKNQKGFIAIKCDSIQQARDCDCYNRIQLEINYLGPKVIKSNHGIFYLSTSKSFPFYLGQDGLKAEYASWRKITDINEGNETEVYT
ncbi:pancreatic lipase-related protein 2-like [Galleria mellonella]|uniref:Pancreatic lipase-related protein 2-like n=1 Tax=Galleria mellonella TaxID=7137 RepID=A0A6J3C7Y4_GALME|nr:pancreatic lipase-related protein 2-like [Galleria mellonella]